jgi:hypothetical protein
LNYSRHSGTYTHIKRKRREEKRREEKKVGMQSETIHLGARNIISGFEGSQAVPARPPCRDNAFDRN